MRRTLLALAGLGLALAACRSAPPVDYTAYRSVDDPVTTATRIARAMGDCWFGDSPGWSDYIYAPELNSFSGRPRVLVVTRADPTGLPRLVVEASRAERGTEVRVFGPMLAGERAGTIRADVARWSGGTTACA